MRMRIIPHTLPNVVLSVILQLSMIGELLLNVLALCQSMMQRILRMLLCQFNICVCVCACVRACGWADVGCAASCRMAAPALAGGRRRRHATRGRDKVGVFFTSIAAGLPLLLPLADHCLLLTKLFVSLCFSLHFRVCGCMCCIVHIHMIVCCVDTCLCCAHTCLYVLCSSHVTQADTFPLLHFILVSRFLLLSPLHRIQVF